MVEGPSPNLLSQVRASYYVPPRLPIPKPSLGRPSLPSPKFNFKWLSDVTLCGLGYVV